MPIAHVNGVDLYYETAGTGERLILTHGSWTNGAGWSAVAGLLSDRFEVVSWDRRGHSRSQDGPGPGSRDQDAADLAALIEYLGGGPVHLAGNSYGSIVVLTLVAARSDLVRSALVHEPPALALLEGTSNEEIADTVAAIQREIQTVLDLIERGHHAAAAEHFVDHVAIGPGAWKRLPDASRATFVANAPTFLDEARDPSAASIPLTALAASSVPLLVTYGTNSPAWFHAIVAELGRKLPAARVQEIGGAGHVPHTTHPEEWVATWLAYQEQLLVSAQQEMQS